MIVPPEAATRPGRTRRAFRAVALVLPVALLVVVVGAGLLGPRPEPLPSPPASAEAAAEPSAPSGPRRPAWIPTDTTPSFPDAVAGLPVRSVPDAATRLDAAGDRPVAVAGWLGELEPPLSCPIAEGGDTRGVLSPLCVRRARLMVADPASPRPGAHLHLTVPPGVRLPEAFERRDTAGQAVAAVVLVGRANPPGADCAASARGCREQLTVDAVAWADDAAFIPGPVQDAGLVDTPPAIAYRRLPAAEAAAARDDGTVLLAAVVRPATLALIDPEAGAALARAPMPRSLVWYVRAVAVAPGGDPADPAARIRWAVVDETTGRRLAAGVAGDPGRTSVAPVVPPDVAGLPVVEVGALGDGTATPSTPPVAAVTGYLLAWADPQACTRPIPGLPAIGCPREAVLAAEPWVTDSSDATEPPGEHLHALVPPGVVVPDAALQVEGGDGIPAQVVLVVRASRETECPGEDGCAPWVVERVAWADGTLLAAGRQAATPLSAAGDTVGEDPAGAARDAIGHVDLLLRAVLLDRRQLRILDPDAARALRQAGGATTGPVWYLRGLDLRTTGPARIRWAVTSAPDGRRLVVGTARTGRS